MFKFNPKNLKRLKNLHIFKIYFFPQQLQVCKPLSRKKINQFFPRVYIQFQKLKHENFPDTSLFPHSFYILRNIERKSEMRRYRHC
jgi:hypothetical protein